MGKNIVFCADGTWNGPDRDDNKDGVPDVTNVMRLFSHLAGLDSPDSLRKQDEQEKVLADGNEVRQVSKYIHGVGDSRNPIKRLLGGVFGGGFVQRIVRGYTFVSRHYEPGDNIFLLGFSRGAYTARALGGMIAAVGLLDKEAMKTHGEHDYEKAYRLGTYQWTQYRKESGKRSPLLGYLAEFESDPVEATQTLPVERIAAIAVWDTVGSLGIPLFKERDGSLMDVYQFADTKLSPKVGKGFHALAIDEERMHFEPTLWDSQENIQQVWFAGAHSDVGGGYPDPCLSNLALRWMAEQLSREGVLFERIDNIKPVNEFIPCHTPWLEEPFDKFKAVKRTLPPDARIHKSVDWLLQEFSDRYSPSPLDHFRQGNGRIDPRHLADD